jgi:hypothetical protein
VRDCGGCRQRKPPTEIYSRPTATPYAPCKGCRRSAARSRYQAMTGELERLRAAVQVQMLAGGDLA